MTEFTPGDGTRMVAQKERLSRQVSRILMSEIQSGAFKPGDKLPTEVELAGKYGVSRTVMREALATLKDDNILESKQGKGIVVKNPEGRRAFRISDVYDEITGEEANSLYEMRAILEAEAAWLAALRCTEEEKAELTCQYRKMVAEYEAKKTGEEPHLEFNKAVAKASHNPFLQEFQSFLLGRLRPLLKQFRTTTAKDPDRASTVLKEHEVILKAILDGNPEDAREATLTHLKMAAKRTGLEIFGPLKKS